MDKKEKFKEAEQNVFNLGKAFYGPNYKPRVVTVETGDKKKGDNLSVTVFNEVSFLIDSTKRQWPSPIAVQTIEPSGLFMF